MKLFLVIWLTVFGLFLQDPQNPDDPSVSRPEPPEYAEGVFCSPKGDVAYGVQTGDHPCHCHRMNQSGAHDCCDHSQDSHEKDCAQWCHESHCSCPVECPAHKEGTR